LNDKDCYKDYFPRVKLITTISFNKFSLIENGIEKIIYKQSFSLLISFFYPDLNR